MWPMLALAALGAAKGYGDKQEEKNDKLAAAEMQRWSPWTGMRPDPIQRTPGVLGSALQGGVTGAMLGQGMDQQDQYSNYLKSQQQAPGMSRAVAAPPGQYYSNSNSPWMNV